MKHADIPRASTADLKLFLKTTHPTEEDDDEVWVCHARAIAELAYRGELSSTAKGKTPARAPGRQRPKIAK